MKDKKTMLILGAGSSASYGFPTGADLKSLLLAESPSQFYNSINKPLHDDTYYLNSDGVQEYYRYLNCVLTDKGAGFKCIIYGLEKGGLYVTEKQIKDFRTSFKESSSISIDTFISQKNEESMTNVGTVLVLLIIRAFSTYSLDAISTDDWVGYYITKNIDWNENFEENPPEIISFNYDNLFYTKLLHNLKQLKGEVEAKRIMSRIKITHVYGSLSEDDYGLISTINKKEVTEEKIEYFLKCNFERIHFIRGDDHSDEDLLDTINRADLIHVLGYGFDRFNNRVLFGNEDSFKKIVREKFESVTGFGQPDYILSYLNSAKSPDIMSPGYFVEDEKCRTSLMSSMPIDMFP